LEAGMKKAIAKKTANPKPKKLSKIAQWWLEHPEGIGLKILDMRAVLR
jgi:hypothetical protein